jgi:hypothetical protein
MVDQVNKPVVRVVHTARNTKVFYSGFEHGLVHDAAKPFAVVLWDTVAHKVTKTLDRYVTYRGASNRMKKEFFNYPG